MQMGHARLAPFSFCYCSTQDDIATFPDVEYCKTDLVATKGVVFCKFSKASSALKVLETVQERGTVSRSTGS
jgi:hypothetical protein